MKNFISICNKVYAFIMIFSLISCSRNPDIYDNKSKNILVAKALETGKSDDVSNLINYFGNTRNNYEILPYAIILANKYNNGDACFQVYFSMISIFNNGHFDERKINSVPVNERTFAIEYLKRGVSLNNKDCILSLEKIYLNGWAGVPKNELMAKKLRKQFSESE